MKELSNKPTHISTKLPCNTVVLKALELLSNFSGLKPNILKCEVEDNGQNCSLWLQMH